MTERTTERMTEPGTELSEVAPAFVEMAHRIVWATVATVDESGRPRTRVLHPIWEWDGQTLTGWIATSPLSPKANHLANENRVSLTYWQTNHDTCTADCDAFWETGDAERQAGWDRFANAPEPIGFDPSIVAAWTEPSAEAFGILRVEPTRLRVMPGSLMSTGVGELLTWKA
ncbi:MAG: pyridoxamine 5'-phosphate oxidase family protein [Acidimicrobiales bacterium]